MMGQNLNKLKCDQIKRKQHNQNLSVTNKNSSSHFTLIERTSLKIHGPNNRFLFNLVFSSKNDFRKVD